MKKLIFFIYYAFLFIHVNVAQNFIGTPGFYYKGGANIPTPATAYSIPFIDGIFVLTYWSTIEPLPNKFDWSFIDNEISKAANNNKTISIGILNPPNWLHDSLNTPIYRYIKNNPYNPTHGDTLTAYITWDPIYLNRLDTLTKYLSEKYAHEPVVKYINYVSGLITRGLPDSVVTPDGLSPFWTTYNYEADTVLIALKITLDNYMERFPKTPLWSSIDYIRFETKASGNPSNYLISQYASYGVQNYPDRFGLWREDLGGCIDAWGLQNPNSVWYTMAQYTCRHGAQMLWHLQDGPYRMNKCSIAPDNFSANSKVMVLDSIFSLAFGMGMKYFEIYPADIKDPDLEDTFVKWHVKLDTLCATTNQINPILESNNKKNIYPNPTSGKLFLNTEDQSFTVTIHNPHGQNVGDFKNKHDIDITYLPAGNYFLTISTTKYSRTLGVVKTN